MRAADPLSQAAMHLGRLRACESEWNGYHLPLATPPGQRYPYVYPRDLAAVARAFDRLPDALVREQASDALRGAAEFLLRAQDLDGLWGQRYDLDAADQSIYRQEDNPAHAVAVLARHVRHERQLGAPSPIEERCLDAMRRGLLAAKLAHHRPEINLYYSTTSIHESGMETGYTLWTNGAYRDAYRLALQAAQEAGATELAKAWAHELEHHEDSLRRHFVQNGEWMRALTPRGRFDRRADVTLLSPYYFRFEHLDPEASERSARRVERDLWDPDLGLLQRYLPFREDPAIHIHAGNGPWLAYTAWLAQRHAEKGDKERAKDLVARIHAFAGSDGDLPEHVSTPERFRDFMRDEWETGLDFEKEFDPAILLPRVPFTIILEEANRMKHAYDAAQAAADQAGDGVIRFAAPLAWAHAEMAVALHILAGGKPYVDPPAQRTS